MEVQTTCIDAELLNDGKRDWLAEYCNDGVRFYFSKVGFQKLNRLHSINSDLMAARDKAKQDAIKNLARYKFSNFGYHAARWVTLNRIIGDKEANPFRRFVELAKGKD